VVKPLPAGHGGEGNRRSGEFSSVSSRWRDWLLLQQRANHAAAMIAVAIFGRKGGPSRRLDGALLNLQCGGLPQSFLLESALPHHQVVRPRWSRGGRRWRLRRGGEDRGSDCFFWYTFKVLFAFSQGYVVLSLFLQGPLCNLYPTMII
jgi:hypothetical protein